MGDSETVEGGRWEERPGAARAIRVTAFLLPVAGSIATGHTLTSLLPSPVSTTWGVARWTLVAIASTAVLLGVERITRRFIPSSMLFRLTLAFPDSVPSRLGLAMRIGTTTQLAQRIDAASTAGADETPGDAARRLLELVTLLSRHDRLTRGHSERVRAYAHIVGVEMGIDGHELEQLRWAALLHDIGKISVPSEILNKPGRLTDSEFDVVRTHPMAGKQSVEPLADWLGDAVRAVWEHHERFDGGGYPQGLRGTEIAPAARIVCVVDAYDVMTSERSYKRPMSGADARAELSKHAGTQFDPAVVRAFLRASVGAPGHRARRASRLAQLALLPRSLVRQVGPTLGSVVAVGTATAVGTVGGTVGIAMAARPVAPPAVTSTTVEQETSDRTVAVQGAGGQVAVDPSTTVGAGGDVSEPDGAPRVTPTSTDVDDTDAPPVDAPPTTVDDRIDSPPATTSPRSGTTIPNGTVPAGSVPNGTIPDRSVPRGTLPPISVPSVSVPPISVPPVSLPPITLPNVSIPIVPVPVVSIPPVTVPPVTVPPVTVPVVTVPVVTLPKVTLPPVTVPGITLPRLGR